MGARFFISPGLGMFHSADFEREFREGFACSYWVKGSGICTFLRERLEVDMACSTRCAKRWGVLIKGCGRRRRRAGDELTLGGVERDLDWGCSTARISTGV